jgi:hypothetical protein
MQCAAVLLLELRYQSQHTKDDNAPITADIQKLLSWLHVMEQNDPVAERAYFVMRRILQNVAPVLQPKAAELLTQGLATGESYRPGITPHKDQGASFDWAQSDFFDGSASVTGRQYYPQDIDQNYYDTAQVSQDNSMYGNYPLKDFQMQSPFGNPFSNSWDEQNLWYDSHFSSINMPGDLSDMQLYPTSYTERQHQHQQLQSQQPFELAGPSMQHEPWQRGK